MKQFVVLYRVKEQWLLDSPRAFVCMSDSTEEAEDQCLEAYPDCEVVWTHIGSKEGALEEYYDWKGAPV